MISCGGWTGRALAAVRSTYRMGAVKEAMQRRSMMLSSLPYGRGLAGEQKTADNAAGKLAWMLLCTGDAHAVSSEDLLLSPRREPGVFSTARRLWTTSRLGGHISPPTDDSGHPRDRALSGRQTIFLSDLARGVSQACASLRCTVSFISPLSVGSFSGTDCVFYSYLMLPAIHSTYQRHRRRRPLPATRRSVHVVAVED